MFGLFALGDSTPEPPKHIDLCETCSLDCARKGEHFEIVSVNDDHARMQALRFGMAEGARIECITKVPAGPVVLRSGRQEIAVGRALAKKITVRRHEHGGKAAS